jgi:hypothetical protein
VDLLGEPRSLRLLGLDDPHLDVRRQAVAGALAVADEARIAALKEEPGRLEVAQRDLELRELRLLLAELAAERVDLRPERPDAGVLRTDLGGDRRSIGGSAASVPSSWSCAPCRPPALSVLRSAASSSSRSSCQRVSSSV